MEWQAGTQTQLFQISPGAVSMVFAIPFEGLVIQYLLLDPADIISVSLRVAVAGSLWKRARPQGVPSIFFKLSAMGPFLYGEFELR